VLVEAIPPSLLLQPDAIGDWSVRDLLAHFVAHEQRALVEALALAGELGMRPLVARCHLGLGRLCRRTGKRQAAQEHLTTAVQMYREMDMRFWLEQARAETTELT
jgi:hypothetical protein